MFIQENSMHTRRIKTLAIAGTAWLAALGAVAMANGANAAGTGFVTMQSSHDYSATLDSLQHAIKKNGLMVMGKVNQKAILSMTGLHLEGGESFLVGNPRVGKKLFGMSPAMAAVIPARISVWAEHGKTFIGYFKPSSLMGAISNKLSKPGMMLDMKFHQIVEQAAK
jgi:uncharacterized protein (DUF302 family)